MIKVPFARLTISDRSERKTLLHAFDTVCQHGRFINGPEVELLERRIARYCDTRYAAGVGSGTTALIFALKSLGIGVGDEVITTSLSWIATANAIAAVGALPVFADIQDDLNIDPVSVERLITKNTKAIIGVHFTGKICAVKELCHIARSHDLYFIEDAAQAFGAEKDDNRAGSFGDVACFSLNPMKVLASCGEAGMVVTNQKRVYEKIRVYRNNGMIDRVICPEPSMNGRLDTVQAAIVLERLPRVPEIIRTRRAHATRYREMLGGLVHCPHESVNERDVYFAFTLQTNYRDQLRNYLLKCGIETQIQHPRLMPLQPAYRSCRGEYSHANVIATRILSLPVHESITEKEVEYVGAAVIEFFRRRV
jgi:dTDP-4-amino-4,6-dideoxygalactose transaminase